MICFPLDNTEYDARGLGAWLGTRTRGVFSADGHYAVTANGDMSVTLGPGLAWLKPDDLWGTVMLEVNPTVLPIATADGSLTRFAAVCLRIDKNSNAPGAVIKYGPFGTNPGLSSLPSPEQNSLDYDEIYVAAIRVRAGATEISAGDITDLRLNETYCGIMRDGVTGIPTQELYDSWQGWFDDLQARSEGIFWDWFNNLQNELDANQAANLQNQITQHSQKTPVSTGGIHGLSLDDGQLQMDTGGAVLDISRNDQLFATTLATSGWSGKQYTVTHPSIQAHTSTLLTMMEISPLEAAFGGLSAATSTQIDAWVAMGNMAEAACVDGSYTIIIDGTVPSVAIPVLVTISRATAV